MRFSFECIIVVISIFSGSQIFAQDTLYVAAKNGLNLRSEPNTNSSLIRKLELNEVVVVDSIYNVDTISNRIGNWVFVHYNSESGFLFDGYLNKIRIEVIEERLFGSYIIEYLKKGLDLDGPISMQRPCSTGSKSCYSFTAYYSDDCYIKTEYGWEWSGTEIVLKNWSINEILNILENAECYMNVCDYPIAIKSKKPYLLEWETQTDELLQTKIVEGENGNLQININWTYH